MVDTIDDALLNGKSLVGTTVKILLVLTSLASLYLLCRLYARPVHWLERGALTLVLLTPFVGWIAYLFLVEEVPPQDEDLKNTGPRGFYTDRMITRTRPGHERRKQPGGEGDA